VVRNHTINRASANPYVDSVVDAKAVGSRPRYFLAIGLSNIYSIVYFCRSS